MQLDWGKGDVIEADGQAVAYADRTWLRERAEVQVGPELWRYKSGGWGSASLVAELDGTIRFTARRSGLLSPRWTIDIEPQLELARAGLFSSRLVLSRGSTRIGEVARSGLFSSRPRMTLTEDLETRTGCFVLWLAFVELNRQSNDGA